MELNKFQYINSDDTMETSNRIILNSINDLMKFNNKMISKINSQIVSGKDQQSEKDIHNSVIINSDTLEIIDINNSNINHLCELFNLLRNIKDLDLLMDYDTYLKFRYKFTNLYFKAFFDDNIDRNYAFDSDEINQILSFRKLEYQITMQKIDGQIFYKLSKKDGN